MTLNPIDMSQARRYIVQLEGQLESEREKYTALINDLYEGIDCWPECDGLAHEELCPVTNFQVLLNKIKASAIYEVIENNAFDIGRSSVCLVSDLSWDADELERGEI